MTSQNILISTGGTVNVTGSGTEVFYDAGGPAGNDGNTSYTITLAPANPGEKVLLDFTSFKTMFSSTDEDPLYIYDGPTATGLNIGKLMGDYTIKTGNGTTPYGVGRGLTNSADLNNIFKPTVFSATNSTGCLTLVFQNNSTSQYFGWVANVSTYKDLGTPGCSVNLTANTTTICSGQNAVLTATGNLVASALNNNFNGSLGTGWVGTPSATIVTNVCTSPSIDGTQYLWMQNSAVPRSLESLNMDVSNGGTISFEYRQAKFNSDPSPCEAPDVLSSGTTNEGIFVQYSTDNGTTWNTFKYIFSNSLYSNSGTADAYNNGCGDYVTRWTKMTYPIPTAAKTANTKFRWIQPAGTSATTDNWGLDNVIIGSPKTFTLTIKDLTNNVVLATSNSTSLSVTQSPAVTTVYEATITDGTTTCTSQKTVTVNSCTASTTPTCGTCASAVCPISGPYSDYTTANSPLNQCGSLYAFSPFVVGATTYTTYHTVTTSSSGTLGIIVSNKNSPTGPCSAIRTSTLYPVGSSCTGPILPNTTTANGSTYYNPEWYGLTPSTSYIVKVVYTVAAGCQIEDYCASYYTPTVAVTSTLGCGTCSTPTCPIGSVPTYPDRTYTVCKTGLSITNTTYTEYHTVTSDAFGNLGVAQQVGLNSGTNAGITKTAYLLPIGNCGATQILPTLPNANGVASNFNPEWNGLTPNTQYILVITIVVNSTTIISSLCTDYYGIPVTCPTVGFTWNPTTPSAANLSCSNNTDYRLKANLTGSLGNEGQYIAPGFTIDDGGVISLTNIKVSENNGAFVSTFPSITLTYCVPSYNYSVQLNGTGTGTIRILDHATGNVLFSGPFVNGMIISLPAGTILGSAVFQVMVFLM